MPARVDQQCGDPAKDETAQMRLPGEAPVHGPPQDDVERQQQPDHLKNRPKGAGRMKPIHVVPGQDASDQTKKATGGTDHGHRRRGKQGKADATSENRACIEQNQTLCSDPVTHTAPEAPERDHVHDQVGPARMQKGIGKEHRVRLQREIRAPAPQESDPEPTIFIGRHAQAGPGEPSQIAQGQRNLDPKAEQDQNTKDPWRVLHRIPEPCEACPAAGILLLILHACMLAQSTAEAKGWGKPISWIKPCVWA